MTQRVPDGLIGFCQLVIAVLAIVAVLGCIGYISFNYFEGWATLWAVEAQLGILIIVYKLFRWWRYPGLFHAKSSGRLVGDVLLSVIFIGLLTVYAALARLHLLGLVPVERIARYLDLDFSFHQRDRVQVSSVAPPDLCPGQWGRVRKVRIVQLGDSTIPPLAVGTAIYQVEFEHGVTADVPESELIPPD